MSSPGTYIVVLKSGQAKTIQIGKLAQMDIRKGYYAYVGSALGPGGVEARLKHHRKVSAKPHWHLDYLRAETEFYQAYALYSPDRKECEWAVVLDGSEAVSESMKGFGSSDCRCSSHLFYFASHKNMVRAIHLIEVVQRINLDVSI
ncbi:MAG: GIY-YIG nuclease family protein [Gammaproteobacteria bacterium]|nr:GIY-YIG nuclease family protein [Gammaproteobacteria bacterium]